MSASTMTQTAPYPEVLDSLVRRVRYRPGWTFRLRDIIRDPASTHSGEASGLTLIIITRGYDAYNVQNDNYGVQHYFPVPAATYNEASWLRWVFDCVTRVETHEACEFFTLTAESDVVIRPYAPTHGPGDDPYVVHEYATNEQARTSFRGEVKT